MKILLESEVYEKVKSEVEGWPGVMSRPHRFGGTEFRIRGREMGHIHGGRFADLPFPMNIRDRLVRNKKTMAHHVLPNSGWITFLINNEHDITTLIELFRMPYDRLNDKR